MRVTPEHVLRSILVDQGIVSRPEARGNKPPCYTTSLPVSPDTVVVITKSVGKSFGREARTGRQLMYPGVLVRIRALSDQECDDLAIQIATVMDSVFPVETTTPEDGLEHAIQNMNRITPIVLIGEEQGTKRILRSINAWIVFEDSETFLG